MERRLSLASNGNVVFALKTPYDDGTTHVLLCPMEFMGRLTALVHQPGRITASIKDPKVIQQILKQRGLEQESDPQNRSPPTDLADKQSTLF